MKKLSLVATLPRLDSINLRDTETKRSERQTAAVCFSVVCVCVCVCVPGKVHGGVGLRLVRSQCIIDVLQIVQIRKFRDPTGQHLVHKHTHA